MNARAFKAIETAYLPDTLELLLEGGDARILTVKGRNEYGCGPDPDPDLVSFASCTASTISEAGFAAADALRARIFDEPDESTCDREFNRIRDEFASLCGLKGLSELEILLAASGTDAHLIASRLISPELIVMVEHSETGRGVPAALAERHLSARSAHCQRLTPGEAPAAGERTPVSEVSIRNADGTPRNIYAIDDDISRLVTSRAENGGKVLLVLVDVSKTGMIAPSPSCAMKLQADFPDSVEILVDACQFRMAPATLRAYLEKGFMVTLTGSKFLTGPAFSGALLIPRGVRRLKTPGALSLSSSTLKWPDRIRSRCSGAGMNFGLLLRWEAALAELRAFLGVPAIEVEKFLRRFAHAIKDRLESDPNLEPLTVPAIDRQALTGKHCWDDIQTIFPFRLRKHGARLEYQETCRIHALLPKDLSCLSRHPAAAVRCSLGQPVHCGEAGNALRLCASARLVVEGVENTEVVIKRAFSVFDKIDLLLHLP